MRYIGIDVKKEEVRFIETDADAYKAVPLVGLEQMKTDTGHLWPGCSIILYEFGMLEDHQTEFFAFGPNLYQGNALLYGYDREGETISLTQRDLDQVKKKVRWFHSREEVEAEIARGLIDRPMSSVNGVTTWQWGNPQPDEARGRGRRRADANESAVFIGTMDDFLRDITASNRERIEGEAIREVMHDAVMDLITDSLRRIAKEFSMSEAHRKECIEEFQAFLKKWMDNEKFPRDPSLAGENAAAVLREEPSQDEVLTSMAKAIFLSFTVGADLAIYGMGGAPGKLHEPIALLMSNSFSRGAAHMSGEILDRRRKKADAAKGERPDGDGGGSEQSPHEADGTAQEGSGVGSGH